MSQNNYALSSQRRWGTSSIFAAEYELEGLILQTLTIACCRRTLSSWA